MIAPRRLLVTGTNGQVATSLVERARGHANVVLMPVGRPELDLNHYSSIRETIASRRPDAILSVAAYTAVDKAETEPKVARAINAEAVETIGAVASELGIPVLHLSTDYVFAGTKNGPYVETDRTGPTGVYGETKLAGEQALLTATGNAAIFRTAWVYSPFGANFVKTMLRLAGEGRGTIRVVADQIGNPTSALDIADGLLAAAGRLLDEPANGSLRGTFHMTGQGAITWAGFAREIFAASRAFGGPFADVVDIATADYPTPARRPANSRLDGDKLQETYGLRLPLWQDSLKSVIARLVGHA